MQRAWTTLCRFLRGDQGQDLIEYGMLGALIAVMAVAAVTTLGRQIQQALWQTIANNF